MRQKLTLIIAPVSAGAIGMMSFVVRSDTLVLRKRKQNLPSMSLRASRGGIFFRLSALCPQKQAAAKCPHHQRCVLYQPGATPPVLMAEAFLRAEGPT